jgi:hypothetical protein
VSDVELRFIGNYRFIYIKTFEFKKWFST